MLHIFISENQCKNCTRKHYGSWKLEFIGNLSLSVMKTPKWGVFDCQNDSSFNQFYVFLETKTCYSNFESYV